MAQLIPALRKADVLKRPSLPCLSRFHTINLTAGCPYECNYCYARSFRSNPGQGKVVFYENTLDLLRQQLPRKRALPKLVYFSTACEPFSPFPEVLEALYGVMELLLSHGISLLISTKSHIPHQFLRLFAAHPEKVIVQMGLTTADDQVRRLVEPHAACIQDRAHTLQALVEQGVQTEVRCDPLIPGLTDTANSFDALSAMISARGIDTMAVSYLFLRRGNLQAMRVSLGEWSFNNIADNLYTKHIVQYCGNNTIRLPATAYRQQKYRELQAIAGAHGMHLRLCRCKNPDVTEACCHPRPQLAPTKLEQATLL